MNSLLAKKIEAGDFIITAEYLPGTDINAIPLDTLKRAGADHGARPRDRS